MPKVEIDYNNTTFYKIYCKNSNITDMYIGHTTNFIQRKYAHKQSYLNKKYTSHTCKVYNAIRDHGGWDNWNIEIIAFHKCEDHYSARKQEQYYLEKYNATLNSIEPLSNPKIIITYDKKEKINRFCETCNISFSTDKQQDDHNKTTKHIKLLKILTHTNLSTNLKNSKYSINFSCEKCAFICSNKQDYTRHLSTMKHEILTNTNKKTPIKTLKNSKVYICTCGNSYKHASSLCGHKKKCNYIEEIKNEVVEVESELIEQGNAATEIGGDENELTTIDPNGDKDEIIMKLLKQNSEVIEILKTQQKQMDVIIPKIGNTTNNNNNNNTTNNFNLNVFLNETCKDALNIRDFINSLSVQCSEMKEIQNIGFIEVATKLLIKELSGMDITKRPIHCSDLKRETLYIKDNDVWGKESENKPTMLHMISQMQKESYTTLDNWANKHPGYIKPDHPCHQTYMDTWGDICTLDPIKDVKKISKRIAREVLIDKT